MLPKLQADFRRALSTQEPSALADVIAHIKPSGTVPADDRLSVYRANVLQGLVDILLSHYPQTARLLGEENFRVLAREFAINNLADDEDLNLYHPGLPDFLRRHASLTAHRYVASMATADWARHQAARTRLLPPLNPQDLATVAHTAAMASFAPRLQPSCQIVQSPHPLSELWDFIERAPSDPTLSLRLSLDVEAWLFWQRRDGVQAWQLSPAALALLTALQQGATLASAAEQALTVDMNFDLPKFLAEALRGEIFISMESNL